MVAALTFVVSSRALWNGFVEWDDYVNLLDNPGFRGLGWQQLRWMFSSTLMGHYIPVTWLTFGLDYTIWGLNPFGYHLTNTLIHAVNALLVYRLALRLLRRATALESPMLEGGAAVAALFFALHPLRVESVAWATERRDMLSGLFFLVCVLLYLKACESTGRRHRLLLGASLAGFLLALLSKSIVMGGPLVLVLLDVYPLRRLRLDPRALGEPDVRRVWLEKVPYFLLGLAGAAMSYHAVAVNRFLTPFSAYPWPARIAMGFYSLWFYAWKTVLPLQLSPLYELPARVDPLTPRFVMPAVWVILITGMTFLARRRWPAGLAVWAYYAIILAPVTGVIHSGFQLAHDRYSYLSCLGFALLVGAGVGALVRLWRTGRISPLLGCVAAAAILAWLVGLGSLSWQQTYRWHDTETLWAYAIDIDPRCDVCQGNLGVDLLKQGRVQEATVRLRIAAALRPDRVEVQRSLGIAALKREAPTEAIGHFSALLARRPDDADAKVGLAVALARSGNRHEAIRQLRAVAQTDPHNVYAKTDLGEALLEEHRAADAVQEFLSVVGTTPNFVPAQRGLARAYVALGRRDDARRQYEILSRIVAREPVPVPTSVAQRDR